ncbi:MAG: metallophosphoesterase [Bdellovibrionaceae bacterium]|nr:metallophosphoesterase [Bdellovibrionales bacterium]MCB9254998.1 metallophosphoesterase [Pseudobdellovibrionaceae bacterium]
MKKIKLVMSDFHLGRGRRLKDGSINALEDFFWDYKFREFIEFHTKPPYDDAEIELIFNGDMLNLILTDYHGHFTVILTEAVSLFKLHAIIEGHPVFFKTLREFLKHPKHSLTYIIGNHDQEMLWEKARHVFEDTVGARVNWQNTHYQVDGVHIEHGHQYEAVNRFDPTQPFLTKNLPEPIINLPWGSLFAVQFIIKLKMLRPMIDKVRPFRQMILWCLVHDTWFAITNICRLIVYFLSTRFTKNRYRQSSLKTTFRILRETSVYPDLTDAAKRILRTPEVHTVIFGHTHVHKHLQIGDGKQYINLGTWNETLSLDLSTYGKYTKLTYARIEYPDAEKAPVVYLRHWIGHVPVEDDAVVA